MGGGGMSLASHRRNEHVMRHTSYPPCNTYQTPLHGLQWRGSQISSAQRVDKGGDSWGEEWGGGRRCIAVGGWEFGKSLAESMTGRNTHCRIAD